jgi:hypothetical protein
MNKKLFIALLFTLVLTVSGWSQDSRTLKEYDTYQTSLTKEDIMRLFVNEVETYLRRYDSYGNYYDVYYKVEQDKNHQNYAWFTGTYEKKYQWGTVYEIRLGISNAFFYMVFCNASFITDGQAAQQIITTRAETVGGNQIRANLTSTATAMFNESEMTLKMYNDNYSDSTKKTFLTQISRLMF